MQGLGAAGWARCVAARVSSSPFSLVNSFLLPPFPLLGGACYPKADRGWAGSGMPESPEASKGDPGVGPVDDQCPVAYRGWARCRARVRCSQGPSPRAPTETEGGLGVD